MGETTVRIAPPLAGYLGEPVKSGQYATADEAVAGRLSGAVYPVEPETPQYTEWLCREIQKGLDGIEAGRAVDWDPDEIMREVERRHAER